MFLFSSLSLFFTILDEIFRVLYFRTMYLWPYKTVVSLFVGISGCLALVAFILRDEGMDVTTFNFAIFRNLTCDASFGLLGKFQHAFGGFPFIDCKLKPVRTRGSTGVVLFHFPAHLLFFTSTISNFF